MPRKVRRIRTPVRRERAEQYILISLLSFGFSVGATRLFLELTGFPQIGNSELHISHVLWGGLALFVAALLPLIFANRWVYILGAAFAGIGVGLFIDEVGKFVTQSYDYFFPPAAPIIYGFFLMTVFIYLLVRKPRPKNPRTELYHALDSLEEILDHDLEPAERAALEDRLTLVVNNSENPSYSLLATHLLEFIETEHQIVAEESNSFWDRSESRLREISARWITINRLKAIVVGLLLALGITAFLKLGRLLLPFPNQDYLASVVEEMILIGRIASPAGLQWFVIRIALEGAAGGLLIVSSILLLINREKSGYRLGMLGLILDLTTVNLLIFYFDQFATILTASIQFLALILLIVYRNRTANEGIR